MFRLTTRELFDSDRPRGELFVQYRDWNLKLSDRTILTNCILNYIVEQRFGAAYYELFLDLTDPISCNNIIKSLLGLFISDPQFLLPETLRKNLVRIRRNDQDVMVKYNQLPILPSFSIYCTARLDLLTKENLVTYWETKGVQLTIIDQNFTDTQYRNVRPFAFICHAHADKETIVKPLAERLKEKVGTIWYDDYSLRVGDSLRESIENGIRQSDRCVIVFTKEFLKNKGWAKREFDSIYTKEIVEKLKVMLPVWVDVTPEDLYEYSAILADRVGLKWSDGIENVVKKLAKELKRK